jgi:hypothetical protein
MNIFHYFQHHLKKLSKAGDDLLGALLISHTDGGGGGIALILVDNDLDLSCIEMTTREFSALVLPRHPLNYLFFVMELMTCGLTKRKNLDIFLKDTKQD